MVTMCTQLRTNILVVQKYNKLFTRIPNVWVKGSDGGMCVIHGPFLDISIIQFYQRVLLLYIRQRNTHIEEEEDISGDRR